MGRVITKENEILKRIKAGAFAIRGALSSLWRLALSHKIACAGGVLLFILIMYPLLSTGVTIGDDLARRLHAMNGFGFFLRQSWSVATYNGRLLSLLPLALSEYLIFIGSSAFYIGFVKICLIFASISVFGYFLYKVFKNTRLAIFTSLAVLLTMPLTFEHSPPGAYAEFIAATIILLCSLICYIRYLESASIKPLIISSAALFIAMCFLESYIMYTPVYFFLAWRFTLGKEAKLRRVARALIGPFSAAVLYLALYIASSAILPTSYGGNQLAFKSVGSSLSIIGQLVLSSLPGYYLLNRNSMYLYNQFSDAPVTDVNITNILSLLLKNSFSSIRVITIAALALIVIYFLFRKKAAEPLREKLWPLLAGVCCIILPAVPNALAARYQGEVHAFGFIALPVSYCIHFASVFVICFLCIMFIERFKLKRGFAVLSLMLVLLCIPIQSMNEVNAREQARAFRAVSATERFFNTSAAKSFIEGGEIAASDIFRKRTSLAIDDFYWTEYAKTIGLGVNILNEPFSARPDNLFFQDDRIFVLSAKDYRIVLCAERLNGPEAIRVGDSEYLDVDFNDPEIQAKSGNDNGFYRYCFQMDSGRLTPVVFEEAAVE